MQMNNTYIIDVAISPAEWSIKNISKYPFHLIRSSNKIFEFGNVKFIKNRSSRDSV